VFEEAGVLVALQAALKKVICADPLLPRRVLPPCTVPKHPIDLFGNLQRLKWVMPQDRHATPAPSHTLFQDLIGDVLRVLSLVAARGLEAAIHERQRKFQQLAGGLLLKVVRRERKARTVSEANPVREPESGVENEASALDFSEKSIVGIEAEPVLAVAQDRLSDRTRQRLCLGCQRSVLNDAAIGAV